VKQLVALMLAAFAQHSPASPVLHVYVHYDYLVFSGVDAHSDEPDPAAIQLVVDAYLEQRATSGKLMKVASPRDQSAAGAIHFFK
jgi:hypothetical protein